MQREKDVGTVLDYCDFSSWNSARVSENFPTEQRCVDVCRPQSSFVSFSEFFLGVSEHMDKRQSISVTKKIGRWTCMKGNCAMERRNCSMCVPFGGPSEFLFSRTGKVRKVESSLSIKNYIAVIKNTVVAGAPDYR